MGLKSESDSARHWMCIKFGIAFSCLSSCFGSGSKLETASASMSFGIVCQCVSRCLGLKFENDSARYWKCI